MSGRRATTDVRPGDLALSVGQPRTEGPPGWQWVALSEIAQMATGHTPSRRHAEYWGGEIPWISVRDARPADGGTITQTAEKTNPLGIANSAAVVLPMGTVCLSRTGSIGYAIILGTDMATSQGFVNWICTEALQPRFLQLLFLAENPFLHRISEGVAHTTIYFPEAKAFHVCLPPAGEQHRIVEALDSYLSRVDAAQVALERVQTNLERYRASVLQAAVEGRLVPTEAELAREQGRDYEPASALLERILIERRQRWEEAELAKLRAKGKEPKNDNWKAKYKEPVAPDTSELPGLPEEWCWTTLDALAEIQGGIQKGKKRKATDILRSVPYLRVANVQRGFLDLKAVTEIPATDQEIERLRLQPGDVLFNEGGDRDKLGRGWIWSAELPECIHQNHVFRARPIPDGVMPKYLSWYGNTRGMQYFFDEGKQTTNLASLNLTKLRKLPVPLPPRREQERISEIAEEHTSVASATTASVFLMRTRVDRLRQAVLKWAFAGKLVDQDPNDEPASVLLERIRAEREANSPKKRTRPKKKATA